MKETEKTVSTANEITNVKDIKNGLLYRKDNVLVGYLRVYPFNIHLLSREELRQKTDVLAAAFEGADVRFVYFSLPREVDLDTYKNFLQDVHMAEIENPERRKIIREMMQQANNLASNGENYEHQHYIRLWSELGEHYDEALQVAELKGLMADFIEKFAQVKIQLSMLSDVDILKVNNLFANSVQAAYDPTLTELEYTPLTRLKGGK